MAPPGMSEHEQQSYNSFIDSGYNDAEARRYVAEMHGPSASGPQHRAPSPPPSSPHPQHREPSRSSSTRRPEHHAPPQSSSARLPGMSDIEQDAYDHLISLGLDDAVARLSVQDLYDPDPTAPSFISQPSSERREPSHSTSGRRHEPREPSYSTSGRRHEPREPSHPSSGRRHEPHPSLSSTGHQARHEQRGSSSRHSRGSVPAGFDHGMYDYLLSEGFDADRAREAVENFNSSSTRQDTPSNRGSHNHHHSPYVEEQYAPSSSHRRSGNRQSSQFYDEARYNPKPSPRSPRNPHSYAEERYNPTASRHSSHRSSHNRHSPQFHAEEPSLRRNRPSSSRHQGEQSSRSNADRRTYERFLSEGYDEESARDGVEYVRQRMAR